MTETIIKLVNVLLAFGLCFCFGLIVGIFNNSKKKTKKRKTTLPKCDCSDVNDCSKWCHAKELFTQDYNNGKV